MQVISTASYRFPSAQAFKAENPNDEFNVQYLSLQFIVHAINEGSRGLDIVVIEYDGDSYLGKAIAEIRSNAGRIPIIVIQKARSVQAIVDALRAGADDVVPFEIGFPELYLRMAAVIKRDRSGSRKNSVFGENTLLSDERNLLGPCGAEKLTLMESKLLSILLKGRGVWFSCEVLSRKIYGHVDTEKFPAIRVIVHRLRRKLTSVGAHQKIASYWGDGYTLHEVPRASEAEKTVNQN